MGELRLALTPTNKALGEVQALIGDWDPDNNPALRRRRIRVLQRRRGTALLIGTKESTNYYHWLLDCLPRWRLVQEAGFRDYDYILLNTSSPRFCEETLNLLEVPQEKRLHCSTLYLYEFDRLVVPAMPFPRWEVAAWVCEWVRTLFADQCGGAPERLYVSRRKAKWRRLVNEAELESQLAKEGFMVIHTEHYSVAEQARLFSNTQCVVTPHGAGLANVIFVPRGGRVIELLPPACANAQIYRHIACACGLGYASVTGDDVNGSAYRIDINKVLQTLEN